MKRKVWIGSIGLIVIITIGVGWYWWYNTQNIRNEVLAYLEQRLEFCKIIRGDINILSNKGEFWLICNNRPFYVEYENGNVSYELNGWGFLRKDEIIWNDLKDCNFYDSRDSQLIFYCPKDLNSDRLITKSYWFNFNDLKMVKIKEGDFLELISGDIKIIYKFLSGCTLSNSTSYKYEGYPPVLLLIFSCKDGNYLIGTDLASVQPPILVDSELPVKEKARISFEKSFNRTISNISSNGSYVFITSDGNLFVYNLSKKFPTLQYQLQCLEDNCLKEFARFFILTPISYTNIKFIQKRSTLPFALFYRTDGTVVSVGKINEKIISFGIKREFIYEQ